MADITTAGTFAAAVLEQAGYVAQARFLQDFRDFFREAGALVYILGGIGGVISMVVFGSFRAARYLLLGPALYWFLVGPTTPIDGVIWQVGGGQPRGMNGTRGEAVSQDYVNRALQDSRLQDGEAPPEVALGFALFARVINSVTRSFTDLILDQEDDNEYLLYLSKGLALDMLITGMPEDGYFTDMMEGDFVARCSDMFGYGIARASYELRDDVVANATGGKDTAIRRQQYYEQEFNKYRDGVYLNPGPATRAYQRAQQGNATAQIPDAVSCREMWQLVARYLRDHAKNITDKILQNARGDQGKVDLACQRLQEKLVEEGDGGGGCDLQNLVTLYLLKNAVYDRRSMGRFVSRITNSVGEPKAVQDGSMIPLNEKVDDRLLAQAAAVVARVHNDPVNIGALNGRDEYLYAIGMGEQAIKARMDADPEFLANKQAQQDARQQFQSVARISAIGGPLDAGFTEYPRYHLRSVRQQLFTWATHLPYWQGVMLYIIAVAYPFMALLVLLPGRAVSFLNVPMAWLWVKSWDIGFAIVMVFERVLWNLLPSLNIARDVAQTPLEDVDMWRALSEAEKFDHTWNLHMYYVCLAMATFAIPVITGYATLRSRRAVLASFTDKMQADARDAGQLAAGAWGVQVMSDRVRMISELQAAASRIATTKGGGAIGGSTADYFGNMAMMAKIAELSPKTVALGNGNFLQRVTLTPEIVTAALAERQKVRAEFLTAEMKAQQDYDKTFHPVLGRWGTLAVQNEAYAAAMDGSGGFEINQYQDSPLDSLIDLHTKKVDKLYEIHGRLSAALPGAGELLGASTQVVSPDGTTHHALDPRKLAESVPRFVEEYGLNDAIRAVNQFAGEHRDEINRLAAKLELPEHLAPRIGNAMEFHEFTTDKAALERIYGLTEPGKVQLDAVLSGPNPAFVDRYTFRKEESLEELPESIRRQVEGDKAEEGMLWPGRAESYKRTEQPIHGESSGEGLPQGFNSGTHFSPPTQDQTNVSAHMYEKVTFSAAEPEGSTFAEPITYTQALHMASREVKMEYGDRVEEEKRRLANLNMEWLTGSKEELEVEEQQKHALRLAMVKPTRRLS